LLALEDVFNIKNGYTPSKSKPEYWSNGDIPWFRMDDIRQNLTF
jgi:type I restriction enzyme S subunit